MPTYVKTGFWKKAPRGNEGDLDLELLVSRSVSVLTPTVKKVYTAFITQIGTGAPTTTILQDTITGLIWTRTAIGTYTLTKTGAFTINKTVPIKDIYTDISGNLLKMVRTNVDTLTLTTYAAVNTTILADDVLIDQYINIEIYT